MRKRLITNASQSTQLEKDKWLALEDLVEVELTSEDPQHPIESALAPEDGGWRAGGPGQQIIRLLFPEPQQLKRIQLAFKEFTANRTQEFVLRWSSDGGRSFREIVRQQWNFSPEGATSEIEDYQVNLSEVTTLELSINPDINGSPQVATLDQLRLA
ncbi:MAG: carbohydrate-binding protein [Gammaproteobacteria bacterium]